MIYRSEPLGQIATIEREAIAPKNIQSGARYVGLEHIESTGALQDVSVENGELASTKFSFTPEHILFGKLRPYLRKIARPEFSGICSTDIIPIKPSAKVDRGYLFHFLQLDEVVNKAASLATGINLPRLSPRILETFDVPLPPLDEQRRIAAALDQADDLRRKRREAIKSLRKLARGAFINLFEGRNSDFRAEQLECLVLNQKIGIVRSSEEFGEDFAFPYVRMDAITREGEFDESKVLKTFASQQELEEYSLTKDDFLFNTRNSRELVGKTTLFPGGENTLFNNNIMRIRFSPILLPEYVAAAFQRPTI